MSKLLLLLLDCQLLKLADEFNSVVFLTRSNIQLEDENKGEEKTWWLRKTGVSFAFANTNLLNG